MAFISIDDESEQFREWLMNHPHARQCEEAVTAIFRMTVMTETSLPFANVPTVIRTEPFICHRE